MTELVCVFLWNAYAVDVQIFPEHQVTCRFISPVFIILVEDKDRNTRNASVIH